jgi:ABC-type nitrate/sulfonate/bicarbonate transport system permease component
MGGAGARRAGSLVSIAAGLLAWWGLSSIRIGSRPLVSTPWAAARALPQALPLLGEDLLATGLRAGLGLAVGVAIGVAVGLSVALVVRRAPALDGLLDFARSIPPAVLLPVFLLAFGYGDGARVATVAAGCVWTMALSITTAAAAPRSARREMLDLAGASGLQAVAWTQPWESLGPLIVGLRGSASTAVVVAVVTEMIAGAERGIGARVISAQIMADTTALTLNVLAIGALGYAANAGLRWLEERVRRAGI